MFEFICAVKWKWWMLKTRYFYKVFFGAMGEQCTICKPMRLIHPERMHFGKHIRIREFARLEAIVEYNEQRLSPKLEISDDTGFEQGLHMTCGESIYIGKNCCIMPYVMITDCTHCYDDLHINVLNQKLITDPVKIGDCCFIGIGARIMPGTHIGRHCIVGANSVVVGAYPDYCVLGGGTSAMYKAI